LTINVHNLLHVHRSVSQLGPLWANSSFEFEDANGDLKALFHGSQNIDMQVITAHIFFRITKVEVHDEYSLNICTAKQLIVTSIKFQSQLL